MVEPVDSSDLRPRRPGLPVTAARSVFITTVALSLATVVLSGLDGHALAGFRVLPVAAFGVMGMLIVARRPENRLGWLFCAVGIAMGASACSQEFARRALVQSPGSMPGGEVAAWLAGWTPLVGIGLLLGLLPPLFPTGRSLGRRWRPGLWAAWAFIVLGAVGNAFAPQSIEGVPGVRNPYGVESAASAFRVVQAAAGLFGLVALVGGLASLVVRWRRAAGDEAQQLKWFAAGIAVLPVLALVHDSAPSEVDAVFVVALPLVPLTMGVAILRHRLYDLDLVINRVVVYAGLSAMVTGLYLAIVVVSEWALDGSAALGVHAAAALAVAATFQPLRSRTQRAVDRLFYGDRSRPYDALARLGRRLEDAIVPGRVLPGVVESVAGALRVPYVAIEVRQGDEWVPSAEYGRPAGTPERFPMTYQATTVGQLLVCPRAEGEQFSSADRRLLADLARQAGVAAHAVQTTTDLQRSRAALVSAREEERRRLRRDLHDGLGPTLAGVTLGLHAARATLRRDIDRAEAMLDQLEAQVEEAVGDIRRLVYGLRPPALDEFGLTRAVQQHAARMEASPGGLSISVEAPAEGLGPLPAAVEVAAYRIVTEALTNVARHACARWCAVRFVLNGALELEVLDDGKGLSADARAGVGLAAMRERAAELGGSVAVESSDAGTRVWARLPVPEPT